MLDWRRTPNYQHIVYAIVHFGPPVFAGDEKLVRIHGVYPIEKLGFSRKHTHRED